MGTRRRLAHKLILGVAATLMVSATLTTADSQELIFSPNISGGSPSQFDQTRLPEKSGSAIKQDDNSTKWTKFPQVPFTDFDWASVDRDFRKNSGGNF
jgi:hypothetical protein